MRITVRLLAGYRQYLPQGYDEHAGYTVQVAPGSRVSDLLADLPIPPGEVYTVFVNGRHARLDRTLAAGDVLSVFPAVGGG